METDIISDADRIAGNTQVLGQVESEISQLEQMFIELEKLEGEKSRLADVVQSLTKEETATLAETTLSESAIVKKLSETRGRRDVQSARLRSTEDRIKVNSANLKEQGATVRRLFGSICGQLWAARQQRMLETLTELFGAPFIRSRIGPRVQLARELTDQTVPMKQLRDVNNKVSRSFDDPGAEMGTLQQHPRSWLAEVTALCNEEPRLTLLGLPTKKQPIEQPGEMAAV